MILNYIVNLVAISSNSEITESGRRKRQVMTGLVSECLTRIEGDVERNITVGPDQTSLEVDGLGNCYLKQPQWLLNCAVQRQFDLIPIQLLSKWMGLHNYC